MTGRSERTSPSGMTTRLALLFAVAGGAAVGNLYWAQPILAVIAVDLGVTSATAGLLITVTQLGYAVGIFLLVPLGDVVDRARAIPLLMVLAAAMLAVGAAAPSFPVLVVALSLVGVTTVSGQFLAPLAGDLAADDRRGRVIGIVASGLLLGIMIARAVSGVLTDLVGWRVLYGAVAVLMLALAVVMRRALPPLAPRATAPYPALLLAVVRTPFASRTARWLVVVGAVTMASFTLFWTGLTFLLSSAPFGFSATQIGLVNLVGIGGAVAAQRVGRLADRGLAVPAIAGGLALACAALVLAASAPARLAVVIVVIAVYSVGVQSAMVLVQTRMLAIDPSARSRLNTVLVVGNFLGGAAGSALAGALWAGGGWSSVAWAGAALLLLALAVWAVQRRRAFA
ncbi:MFS transporter [Microbacterium gilvum]|uniref:MFS transporter n=2 Tax=Microbacterium gilvum TaxID=1336204 RepID=A0ABP9AR57_9MICO